MSKISNISNNNLNEFPTISEFPATIGDPHWSSSNKDRTNTTNKKTNVSLDIFKDALNDIYNKKKNTNQQLRHEQSNVKSKCNEVVDNPEHYRSKVSKDKMKYIIDRIVKRGYIEVIDVIDAFDLNFNIGNSVKYELRLGRKDASITEIDKAIKYLEFEKEMILANSVQ